MPVMHVVPPRIAYIVISKFRKCTSVSRPCDDDYILYDRNDKLLKAILLLVVVQGRIVHQRYHHD